MFTVFAMFYAFPVACSVLLGLWLLEILIRRVLPFLVIGVGMGLVRLQMQRRRNLTDNELLLRRASHPVALAAVTLLAAFIFRPRVLADTAAVFLSDPLAYWLPALLLAATLAYAVTAFVNGLRGCSNRRDGAAGRAALRLAVGAAVAVYLARLYPWHGFDAAPLPFCAHAAGLLVTVWMAATGAVRLLLLLVDGGNPVKVAARIQRRRNAPMHPARLRT